MKRMWQWVRWPLAIVAVLLVVFGGTVWIFLHKFDPGPPTIAYPTPANALEAQRQDLDYFAKLLAMDKSFSPENRKKADIRIAALVKSGSVFEPAKLRVELMRIAALADNGHTHVGSSDDTLPAALPIRIQKFSDGLYVLGAQTAYADLLGAHVESIGGLPVEKAIARLAGLRGGLPGWSLLNATYYAVLQDLLYGTGIASEPDRSTWTFRLRDGSLVTRILPAHRPQPGELDPPIVRWYSTEPVAGYPPGWKFYSTARPEPLPLKDYANNFRRIRLPGSCVEFMQLKAISDADGQSFGKFRDDTESELRALPPCALIVDLRYSIGGDFTQAAGFGKRLSGYVSGRGRVYILTSANTFSATIGTAAAIKEGGGDRVIILGEPVGDRLAFYSEGGSGCMPHFHLCLDYATGKNDFSLNRCDDWSDCFWLDWIFPIHVRSLAPDEFITTSFAQWNDGHDPAFDRAVALATRK